jgi:hypothetical protein
MDAGVVLVSEEEQQPVAAVCEELEGLKMGGEDVHYALVRGEEVVGVFEEVLAQPAGGLGDDDARGDDEEARVLAGGEELEDGCVEAVTRLE